MHTTITNKSLKFDQPLIPALPNQNCNTVQPEHSGLDSISSNLDVYRPKGEASAVRQGSIPWLETIDLLRNSAPEPR
jgi:hypothetical protein